MQQNFSVQELEDLVKKYLDELKAKWDEIKPEVAGWFSWSKGFYDTASKFLLWALDYLIQEVQQIIPQGEDKKKVVMDVINNLYDYVVKQAFPIWLLPVAPVIRKIVIDVIISNAVDYIVDRYKVLLWVPPQN